MATTYATKSNIDDEYGDENVKAWMDVAPAGSLDADQLAFIDQCINWAERRIDSRLNAVAVTPFSGDSLTAMADFLREWAVDLAAIRIYTRKGLRDSTEGAQLKWRYDRVMEDLAAFADGDMGLPENVATRARAEYGHQGTESTTTSDHTDKAFQHEDILET